MRCPEREAWGLYLDEELDTTERGQFEAHLLTCSSCVQVVMQARREGEMIAASLAAEPVPEDLMTVIDRRLHQRAGIDGLWIKVTLPVLVLVSTLLALSLGWLPRLERLSETWGQFLHQGVWLDCVLLVARAGRRLTDAALAGEPLLPTIALLLVCIIWLKVSIGKRGYVRV